MEKHITESRSPGGLSSRISRLHDYYFQGTERAWNNEYSAWTTGTLWDIQFNEQNVHDYAPVACLENTMVGNDRSGTVDNNLNLFKAVELTLTGGKDLRVFVNPMTGKAEKIRQDGPETGAVFPTGPATPSPSIRLC